VTSELGHKPDQQPDDRQQSGRHNHLRRGVSPSTTRSQQRVSSRVAHSQTSLQGVKAFLYDCEWANPLQRWIQDRGCARPLASDLERYGPRHLMPTVVWPGSPPPTRGRPETQPERVFRPRPMPKASVGGIVQDVSHRHDRATADQVVVIEPDPLTPVRRVSLLDAVHRRFNVIDIELDLFPRNERQKQFPRHEARSLRDDVRPSRPPGGGSTTRHQTDMPTPPFALRERSGTINGERAASNAWRQSAPLPLDHGRQPGVAFLRRSAPDPAVGISPRSRFRSEVNLVSLNEPWATASPQPVRPGPVAQHAGRRQKSLRPPLAPVCGAPCVSIGNRDLPLKG
jgi:hypothetical protein